MAEAKTKLGKIPCPLCAHPIYSRVNAAGTVSVSCDECDFSGFAKKGTTAARLLTPAASSPSAPAPGAPPAARKAAAAGFDLGSLAR
jgi:hypothetical protein